MLPIRPKGTVIYRKEDFLKRWAGDGEQGIALLLEPTQAFYDFSSGMEPKSPVPFPFFMEVHSFL